MEHANAGTLNGKNNSFCFGPFIQKAHTQFANKSKMEGGFQALFSQHDMISWQQQ